MHLDISDSAARMDAVFCCLAIPKPSNTGKTFGVVELAIVAVAEVLPKAGLSAESGCKRRRFRLPTRSNLLSTPPLPPCTWSSLLLSSSRALLPEPCLVQPESKWMLMNGASTLRSQIGQLTVAKLWRNATARDIESSTAKDNAATGPSKMQHVYYAATRARARIRAAYHAYARARC